MKIVLLIGSEFKHKTSLINGTLRYFYRSGNRSILKIAIHNVNKLALEGGVGGRVLPAVDWL